MDKETQGSKSGFRCLGPEWAYCQPIILNVHDKKHKKGLLLWDNICVTKRCDKLNNHLQ